MTGTTPRPAFEPDGASVAATGIQDQISPTSSSLALARFEFESGRGNEGTKILMVEWEDGGDDGTRRGSGDWQVAWPGKNTMMSAHDQPGGGTRRLYFLLPPGVTVPPVITLTHQPSKGVSPSAETTTWEIKPLPAIFPPELGASARTAGKKGVLHTIWAKKRISVLQREIEEETRINFEGIGLEMALQEKEWIEQNFGIGPRPRTVSAKSTGADAGNPSSPLSPVSPGSPGGGRLAEKLKGLRVGTSAQALNSPAAGAFQYHNSTSSASQDSLYQSSKDVHPLSPETSDVAISSFAAFHAPTGSQSSITGAARTDNAGTPQRRPFAVQAPPATLRVQQQYDDPSMSSLGSALAADPLSKQRPPHAGGGDEDQENGLFAIAMSPRSPDMTISPFSFSARDTGLQHSGKK